MRKSIPVIMFCGPLLQNGHVETLRIQTAIRMASEERAPLYIVGDNDRLSQMDAFESMAQESGVPLVCKVVATDGKTNSYARAMVSRILSEEAPLKEVYLVTDDWHMEHAQKMLAYELALVSLLYKVIPVFVQSKIRPSKDLVQANHAEFAVFFRIHSEKRGRADDFRHDDVVRRKAKRQVLNPSRSSNAST